MVWVLLTLGKGDGMVLGGFSGVGKENKGAGLHLIN